MWETDQGISTKFSVSPDYQLYKAKAYNAPDLKKPQRLSEAITPLLLKFKRTFSCMLRWRLTESLHAWEMIEPTVTLRTSQ